jgi:hypothetical protein
MSKAEDISMQSTLRMVSIQHSIQCFFSLLALSLRVIVCVQSRFIVCSSAVKLIDFNTFRSVLLSPISVSRSLHI